MAAAEDIAALEASIALGVTSVRHADGRQVQYGTIPEMIAAVGYMRAKLSGVGRVTRSTLISFVRD